MTTPLSEIVVGVLLLFSGASALLGGLGLVRLSDFFMRLHAPALLVTLSAWGLTLASIVHFTARLGSLAPQTWLVIILLSITAPVSTMMLARAGLFRRRLAGDDLPPPLTPSTRKVR